MLISSDARSRPGRDAPPEPTGASAAFTSSDPVIAQARQLVLEGSFAWAEGLLRGHVVDAAASREMLDIIWRIRTAYALSADDLLKKLKEQVPDATADDLDRWRKAGQVQFRMIDGQVAYFGREPANLLRFCDEAKQRRRATPAMQQAWKYHDHLARVVAAARDGRKEEVVPMRHRIRYVLTVSNDAPGVKAGALVRVWLPFEFVSKIAYCAEEEYSTIPSLSEKCLTSGRGDCGVHAMLFITMCRAAGIPARWQSGWQTERVGYDMHDWCEFYVEPWGWLPADPTYGFEKSDDPAVRDFNFGHLPAYRMIVNLDYGRELFPPSQSFRSEPLDFQRGEVEIDGKNLYFPFWDYDMQIEWLDEGK